MGEPTRNYMAVQLIRTARRNQKRFIATNGRDHARPHNFPSIVVWVPFNEAWGQFKTKEIVEWTMKKDPSRLVNSASGGNFEPVGHIMDLHNYPEPLMPDP